MQPDHMPTGLDYDQLFRMLDSTRNDEGPPSHPRRLGGENQCFVSGRERRLQPQRQFQVGGVVAPQPKTQPQRQQPAAAHGVAVHGDRQGTDLRDHRLGMLYVHPLAQAAGVQHVGELQFPHRRHVGDVFPDVVPQALCDGGAVRRGLVLEKSDGDDRVVEHERRSAGLRSRPCAMASLSGMSSFTP